MEYRVDYLLNGMHKRATVQVKNKKKAYEMVARLLTLNGHSNFIIGHIFES